MSLLETNYQLYEETPEELWLWAAEKRISQAIAQEEALLAQDVAMEWANQISVKLGMKKTEVWKLFKRALAAKWFGKPENRAFPPNWSAEEALEYAYSFNDRSVRFSLFPADIACHAISIRLPIERREDWNNIVTQVDKSTAMEMFPEQSPKALCFRRYTTLFGEEVYYEAGIGQAMYVFEAERGQHPIVLATKDNNYFSYNRAVVEQKSNNSLFEKIENNLEELIKRHDYQITHACFGLCRTLGLDYLSIEGYFDISDPDRFLVVDLDLPFDVAFMLKD